MPLNPTALRNMVDRWLNDSCTIRGPGPAPTFDPDSGYQDAAGSEVYSGKCRVRPAGGDRVVVAGEGRSVFRLFDVTLPWDTLGVQVDQLVTVNSSNDPAVTDTVLRVVDVMGGTDGAYRRLVCELVLDQADWEAP